METELRSEYQEIPYIHEKDYKTNSFIRFLFTYVFSFDHKLLPNNIYLPEYSGQLSAVASPF